MIVNMCFRKHHDHFVRFAMRTAGVRILTFELPPRPWYRCYVRVSSAQKRGAENVGSRLDQTGRNGHPERRLFRTRTWAVRSYFSTDACLLRVFDHREGE